MGNEIDSASFEGSSAADEWTIQDSVRLYRTRHWGMGYFAANSAGHVVVRPDTAPDREIDLFEVVDGLRARGITAPVLIRFSDLMSHRLKVLHDAFATAMDVNEYGGRYTAVYPIKVNQLRPVVEEVCRHGRQFGFGLEVGSKPELLAVMATPEEGVERLVICNGYKDKSYLEAVILAQKLGRTIIPVIDHPSELRLLMDYATRHSVRPRLGVRVKLSTETTGRRRDSGGAPPTFGLSVGEILQLVSTLHDSGMADCLELLHGHPGSQIQDILALKQAVSELARIYVELVRIGTGLRFLDIGGGLGVDYDGSRSNTDSSMNYTLEEYASEVVYRIGTVCNESEVDHPVIITESGRALAAYHSVLVFNALEEIRWDGGKAQLPEGPSSGSLEAHPQPIRDLAEALDYLSESTVIECYHDSLEARNQTMDLFRLGYVSLQERALAERLFWKICSRIERLTATWSPFPEELEPLRELLCDVYVCNLSIFQSLPDHWAIGQLFPIMPIHRLGERPTRRAVLTDITCDSDGRIDRFVDARGERSTLDLHARQDDEPYYLAAFLVGAYQETLGDLHNLFGDTHVVHIRLHEEGGWWIDEVVKGDTAREVLSYVQYDAETLYKQLAHDCEEAVRKRRITVAQSRTLMSFYESALSGYTYLDLD